MADTYSPSPSSHELADHATNPFDRRCLTASLVISSVGVATSVVGWWLVRYYNMNAVEEGRRTKDLINVDWNSSDLPLLLFVMFVAGAAAAVLALLGSRAAALMPWKAVVAGMLAASLLVVPVVVAANSLVTAGIWNNTGGD